ncbi:MAG: nucleotidyltransferase family protein [Gammaproteobacteria bacterium]
MQLTDHLLVQVLRTPKRLSSLSLSEWDLLIRQARHSDLLAYLDVLVCESGLGETIPHQVKWHLESARAVADKHAQSVRWDVENIMQALADEGIPVVVLKGAAYVLAGLPNGRGRLFQDIDIMVPKAALDRVEHRLFTHGWVSTHLDDYDQRYYRTWMHELPPLQHVKRKTVLDVHHTILPETAKLHPAPEKLFVAAVPLEGYPGLSILSPADMVLHSATHLFHDGELEHGLRDLVDLDVLMRTFGRDESFWATLAERAVELDLERPLHYALRYTRMAFSTPIPDRIRMARPKGRPGAAVAWLMDALFRRGLAPSHGSCDDAASGLARWVLYVRGHYLRMPLHLLIPHLVRKAVRKGEPEQSQ